MCCWADLEDEQEVIGLFDTLLLALADVTMLLLLLLLLIVGASLLLSLLLHAVTLSDFALSCFGETKVALLVIFKGTNGREDDDPIGAIRLLVDGGFSPLFRLIATGADAGFLLLTVELLTIESNDGIELEDETQFRFTSRTPATLFAAATLSLIIIRVSFLHSLPAET